MNETAPIEETAYEFRRRLTTVLAEGELLLEGERGALTADQRQAIESIVAEGHLLTALIADRIEPAGGDALAESDGIALDPETPGSVTVVTPHPVFGDSVVAELDRSGYDASRAESVPVDEGIESGPDRVAVDLSALDPEAGFGEAIDWEVPLVSIVAGEDATKPVIGLSGLLARAAPNEVVAEVLDGFLEAGESVAIVGEGFEREDALAEIAPVEDVPVGSIVERTHREEVGCVLLGRDALAEGGWSLVWELRRPDGRAVPTVLLLDDLDVDWVPTVGGTLPPGRPLTAVSLASLLLLSLRP